MAKAKHSSGSDTFSTPSNHQHIALVISSALYNAYDRIKKDAMPSTAFEPNFSGSLGRPPIMSADAPSMADSLPNVNFGFDDLRDRMNRFTARFDDFIEKGRKRVLEERNQFRINVAEIQGTTSCPTGVSPRHLAIATIC
jgi:hypothetical protein